MPRRDRSDSDVVGRGPVVISRRCRSVDPLRFLQLDSPLHRQTEGHFHLTTMVRICSPNRLLKRSVNGICRRVQDVYDQVPRLPQNEWKCVYAMQGPRQGLPRLSHEPVRVVEA